MADISQVKLPNGDTYNLVDETSGYIKNYTETDPVFSASAAAGIDTEDIENWNKKAELWTVGSNHASGDYWWTLKINRIDLNSINNSPGSSGRLSSLILPTVDGSSYTTLDLPKQSGTLALTSDIPKVYSSTNTGGYLTMATLPIYDGTVE